MITAPGVQIRLQFVDVQLFAEANVILHNAAVAISRFEGAGCLLEGQCAWRDPTGYQTGMKKFPSSLIHSESRTVVHEPPFSRAWRDNASYGSHRKA
jgi:hypothetical protein